MTTHTVPPELWDDILGKELADELREWDKMPKSQWVTTFAPADKFKIVIGKGGTGQVTFHSASESKDE